MQCDRIPITYPAAASAISGIPHVPADGHLSVPIFDAALGGKSVIGSIVGTRKDLADVKAGFDDVLAGRMPARLVFQF